MKTDPDRWTPCILSPFNQSTTATTPLGVPRLDGERQFFTCRKRRWSQSFSYPQMQQAYESATNLSNSEGSLNCGTSSNPFARIELLRDHFSGTLLNRTRRSVVHTLSLHAWATIQRTCITIYNVGQRNGIDLSCETRSSYPRTQLRLRPNTSKAIMTDNSGRHFLWNECTELQSTWPAGASAPNEPGRELRRIKLSRLNYGNDSYTLWIFKKPIALESQTGMAHRESGLPAADLYVDGGRTVITT